MSDGTQAISRAAELLSIVVRAEDPMTHTSLVDRTGLARSTASRVLQSLERSDLLERDNDGLYRGGRLFAHYAARHDRVAALLSAAEPVLQRIGDDTGETVNLAVVRGRSVTHVAQIDTPHMVGTMNWIDIEVPPHCSALGKSMYAFGALPFPEGRLEHHYAAGHSRTRTGLRSRTRLRDHPEQVRGRPRWHRLAGLQRWAPDDRVHRGVGTGVSHRRSPRTRWFAPAHRMCPVVTGIFASPECSLGTRPIATPSVGHFCDFDAVLPLQRDELQTVVPGGRSARNRCPPNVVTASVDQNRRPNPRRRPPQNNFN